jgi:hypothetical protein
VTYATWNYANLKWVIKAGDKALKEDGIIIEGNGDGYVVIGVNEIDDLIMALQDLRGEWREATGKTIYL